MINISLKRAILKDASEIIRLEKEADAKTYLAMTDDEEVKSFIKRQAVFLIKSQAEVVGLVAYKEENRRTVHFNGLVVSRSFQGQGFAKQAMRLVLKKMTKYPRVELVVHPHNNPAISLYLYLGFEIESWQNNYFGDGEPRLMMVLKK